MPPEPNHNSADDECRNCQIYRSALLALLRKDMPDLTITEEELRDIRQNGASFDEVMKELEKVTGANSVMGVKSNTNVGPHEMTRSMSDNEKNPPEIDSCPQCQFYLKALYALTRKEFTFTEEELRELRERGQSLDPVIEELERRVEA